MRIDRVKLLNYAQHQDLDISIESDFVGIVGENGSGKSNFIHAISDAITGDFHKKKSRIITYGEKTGEIMLGGSFGPEEEFSLFKPLGSGDTTLKIGGQEIVGADAVTSKILERLDCDKSFLFNMVFVRQEDILGSLFGTPAERTKLLQKFFGLERAQKADQALSAWMSTIPESVEVDETAIKEEISQAEQTISKTQTDVSDIEEDIADLEKEIAADEPMIEKVEALYEKARAYERSASEIQKYQKEENDLSKKIKDLVVPSTTQEQLQELKSEFSKTKEKIASFNDMRNFLLSALNSDKSDCGDGTCAVCGSELDEHSKEKIQSRIEFIESEMSTLQKDKASQYAVISQEEAQLEDYTIEHSKLTRRFDFVQSQLDTLTISSNGSPPKRSSQEYKIAIDDFNKKSIEVSNYKARVEVLKNSLVSFNATLTRCRNTLSMAADTKKKNDALRAHKNKVARIQGLFKHNGSATETYVNTKMKRMCATINEYLVGFSASYKVRVDKDNEFICQFPNKTIMSGELSGGQKVVLSLAFRFAACEVFASKTNLIVLDEPTTWLDRKRIDSFGEILSSVKSMSQRKHLQVLVVTHEKSLMPNFDQVIEF